MLQYFCLTETDLLVREGMQRGSGRTDKNASRWCERMTACYDELASRKPVFNELKNCVDLAIVAALIDSRQLADRAGLDLSLLKDASLVQLHCSTYLRRTHPRFEELLG